MNTKDAPPAAPPDKPGATDDAKRKSFVDLLKHPAILLLLTTVLTSIAAPMINGAFEDKKASIRRTEEYDSAKNEYITGVYLLFQYFEFVDVVKDGLDEAYKNYYASYSKMKSLTVGMRSKLKDGDIGKFERTLDAINDAVYICITERKSGKNSQELRANKKIIMEEIQGM